jgi:hypothetical protein
VARWTASAKWAAGLALDGQCATPLGLPLERRVRLHHEVRAGAGAQAFIAFLSWYCSLVNQTEQCVWPH